MLEVNGSIAKCSKCGEAMPSVCYTSAGINIYIYIYIYLALFSSSLVALGVFFVAK